MVELLAGLSITCLVLGCCCNIVAGIGIFFFPDVYSRMHATGIVDTLGTALILAGLMFYDGWDGVGKLLLIMLFTLLTSPSISYILANTAARGQNKTAVTPADSRINDKEADPSNH
jgi:multicomponent Na+:H+ antiporter subunit G